MSVESGFPVHKCLPEPELIFHPERNCDCSKHPLQGLVDYGPFSRSLINNVMDPIRVAMIAPANEIRILDDLLKEIERKHQPKERVSYLPVFLGFSRIFGIGIVSGPESTRIELPEQLERDITSSANPCLVLAERLASAISILQSYRHEFDVILVYLPARWEVAFKGGPEDDFDLHDHLKSRCAVLGMPVQIVREDKALSYPCRCSVMWRMSLALYCKAGGVPWKLADSHPDTAFIGLSYSMRKGDQLEGRYVTCCSQVFDADGAGLEFLLYETNDVHIEKDNPFLSRAEMRRVMARSLSLYQRSHGGKTPRRIVVHKSIEFKRDEVEGCFDALSSVDELDLVHIQVDSIWRGVKIEKQRIGEQKSLPSMYPCDRGTFVQIGGREALLWTQGNAASVAGKDYFKEGKSIPSPLLLKRFAGHGTWDQQCQYILGLTKMNWNNDGLYDRLPVTLGYASILARVAKRMTILGSQPYQLRFFM